MIQIAIHLIVQRCNRVLRKLISPAIFFILVFSFLNIGVEICKASDGNVLYVGGSGVGNYSTIQDAINGSNNYDTIYVYSGEYHENIIIDKPVNLIGLNKNLVFVFGGNKLYTVLLKSSWVNISGFTIQNGEVGICILEYSFNNISENILTNNMEAIHLDNSSNNKITKNVVQNHKNDVEKFAIVCFGSCNNFISENAFIDNSMSVYLGRWSDNNVISDNSITDYSIGIRMDFSFNNVIQKNLIETGGRGIYLTNSKYNNITYNDICNNTYCGIYIDNLKDNIISPNSFTNNHNDVREIASPPTIIAPGFEILFAIFAIFIILILYRRKKRALP